MYLDMLVGCVAVDWTYPHGNCVYILYTKIVQDVCNWCIQNECKMSTTFRQTFVYILYTKSKELCQLNFVYKIYTKVCWNVGYILYMNILYTFCIHQFWCTKFIHLYTNNCMQDTLFQHILTRLLCIS